MSSKLRRLTATAACAAVAFACAGCAKDDRVPVAIGVDQSSPEQVVLGEIYSRILDQLGFAVGVTNIPNQGELDAAEALRRNPVDLVVSCTGAIVETQYPDAARELVASGASGEDLALATYDSAVATLPAEVRTVDPSPAEGCAGMTTGELPMNIIPVFRDGKFDRVAVNRINFITRVMATEDIEKAAEKVAAGSTVADATAEWLLEYAGLPPRED